MQKLNPNYASILDGAIKEMSIKLRGERLPARFRARASDLNDRVVVGVAVKTATASRHDDDLALNGTGFGQFQGRASVFQRKLCGDLRTDGSLFQQLQ